MSARRILSEFNSILDKTVTVKLTNSKMYTGTLFSFEINPFIITLMNAKDSEKNTFYKVIINGNIIEEIQIKSPPVFDVKEFGQKLEKDLNLRPGDVKVYEDVGILTVMDKIKVSEVGVEGSGPLAQRVYEIYNEYMEKRKKEIKQ
jgi:small nuclear ribonucleoprotein (snRNP)-like protein